MKKRLWVLLTLVIMLCLKPSHVMAEEFDPGESTGDVILTSVDEVEIAPVDQYEILSVTADEAYNRMIAMKEDYPEGMHWTNDDAYTSKGYLYENGYRYSMSGRGCHAFALILSDAVYGDLPIIEHTDFNNVKVGDAIRLNNNTHTVMVIGIDDDYLTLAEGNYNSSIHWGRKISRTNTSGWNYIITRDETDTDESDDNDASNDPEVHQSGLFTYTLDSSGNATITGLSSSFSFGYDQTIVIPSVIDGHSVIAIGDEAFAREYFGYGSTVVISDGIQTVGKKAFYCAQVEKICIPKSLKAFGIWDYPFSYFDGSEIVVDPDNPELRSVDGVLYSKDLKTLYIFPCEKNGTVYVTPKETVQLCCTSFGNTDVQQLYLSNPNVTFYTYTFYGCDITVYAQKNKVDQWNNQRTSSWPAGDVTFAVCPSITVTNGSNVTMKTGDELQLNVQADPNNDILLPYSWMSSDPNVAVVDNAGKVYAIKAGTATISVESSYGIASSTVSITVESSGNNNQNKFSIFDVPAGCAMQARMYNPNSGEHFYTGSIEEVQNLINSGWNFEGPGFITPTMGIPIYRLYSDKYGDHFYTTDEAEKNALVAEGWKLEGENDGIAFPSADKSSGVPMYRLNNPNAYPNGEAGAHHFTTSMQEVHNLEAAGWRYEGIAWYSL